MTNKWYDITHLNVLDIPTCHLSFYSSKLQIYPLWLCLWYWNVSPLPVRKMVSFISREPWRDLEEKQFLVSAHPLSWQAPVMLCGQQHMASLHGTSLSNPEGDFPLSQCRASMNFSAIQWATVVPWGLDPSFIRAEAPFHICFFLGCPVLSLEVVAALYICYFCIP